MITATTRVSDALAERPDLRDVLPAFHPAFARLHHPLLGRVLPRLVTVADAARVAGVDVDALVAVMNCPVGTPAPAVAAAPRPAAEPAPAWYDPARVSVLDVRPRIGGGEDPLAHILAALRALPPGGQLTVVAPFEPVPLIGLLGRQGWRAWVRWEGEACHVSFGRGSLEVLDGDASGGPGAAEGPPADAARIGDVWELDVRPLAPPEPMRRILANLDADRLPLRVLHAREPALLYPRLVERGLVWAVTTTSEGVVIEVRRG